jgi:tRNA/tmRNA/rRNA uracil-C5-methylase (TrmA/RlmC/RlmD family)
MSALICPHQPSCPGCPRLATPGLPPEPLGRLQALAARSGAPAPLIHPSAPTGFRYRARLAIRGRADAPKLGIFEAGSHRAVHIPRCLVHHPVVNRVAARVRDTLAQHRVPTYSDAAHAGVARYLQVVVERETARAQVTLVTNTGSPEPLASFFTALQQALAEDLHSLWWNGNPERTNTILGPHWQHLSGPDCVSDRSGNARIFYPPSAFGQSNLELAMQLAARVRDEVPAQSRVTEYYAGVGAIGLGLATTAARLHLNELGPGSLEGLRHGVDALPEADRANVHLRPGAAGEHAALVVESDVVIADPPRKGLDRELLEALVRTPPERFIYVSCDIDSFERDASALLASFRLARLEAFDLFPHTEHLETLAIFERPAGARSSSH